MNLKEHIRSIPDYPKKGILFRDITTLIKNEKAFAETINQIVKISKNYQCPKNCGTHYFLSKMSKIWVKLQITQSIKSHISDFEGLRQSLQESKASFIEHKAFIYIDL